MASTIKVYLVIEPVIRRSGGISQESQSWFRAKWIVRNTGTKVYQSKLCGASDRGEAMERTRRLARAWLAKQNERPSVTKNFVAALDWTGPIYEDTTGRPYSPTAEPTYR